MNRFTQLTPAQFNPMSWEEIASVPLAKRQQHDNQQQAMAELESTLAQINSLDEHEPQAKAIQDYYRNQIENLSGRLASEGVSDDLKGELLSLNSKYKADLSPQGALGKIQGSYDKRQADTKQYYETADKQHGAQLLQQNLNKHNQQYTGYNEQGNIIMPESYAAAPYHDAQKEIMEASKYLGENVKESLTNYDVRMTPQGLKFFYKGSKKVANNLSQVANYLEGMLGEYFNPNTSKGQYLQFSGQDPQKFLDTMTSYAKSIQDSSVTYDESGSPLPGQNTSGVQPSTSQNNIYSGYGDDTSFFGENPTETSVKNNIQELKQSDNPAESRLGRIKETRFNRVKNDYEKSLINKEDGFNHHAARIEGLNKDINFFKENHQSEELTNGLIENVKNYQGEDILKALSGDDDYQIRAASAHYKYKTGAWNRDIGNSKVLLKNGEVIGTNIPEAAIERAEKILPEYKKYYEGLNKSLAHDRHNTHKFVMTGLKSSDNTMIEADALKLLQAFGTNEFKINRGRVINAEEELDLNEVENDGSGGGWFFGLSDSNYDLTRPEDQSELMNILKNAKPGELSWISTSSNNENGLPSVEISYKVPDKDGKGLDQFKGSTIYFNLELNQTALTNPTTGKVTTGIPSGSAYIIDQVEKYGGNQGKALAYTMRNRINYKNIVPQFREDYEQSDKIKQVINPDNLSFDLKDVSFDIDMNDTTGEYSILKSDIHKDPKNYASETLGWNDVLGLTDLDDTQKALQSLSPAFTMKLVQDIKNIVGVNDINQLTDTQADEAIKYLAKNNAALISTSHYDLLNLLKSK